ncbi:hypothetical protein [Alteribacter natronophilus]|uniref:hypothetical protein n=1 Tax=Alteribacter natronophilus TaxID=2583810 RepID=UPI00110E5987|nr:hypothetical protein [Alteribacter natronophilus]TMW71129.1 hypothetical protein FGB90_14290 [Alteribacter natronophilus]
MIKKMGLTAGFVFLAILPLILFFFNWFPYMYSYEQTEQGTLIHHGFLNSQTLFLDSAQVDVLYQALLTNEIDLLRNTALTLMYIILSTGLTFLFRDSHPKLSILYFLGGAGLSIVLIILYVIQHNAVSRRIVELI